MMSAYIPVIRMLEKHSFKIWSGNSFVHSSTIEGNSKEQYIISGAMNNSELNCTSVISNLLLESLWDLMCNVSDVEVEPFETVVELDEAEVDL